MKHWTFDYLLSPFGWAAILLALLLALSQGCSAGFWRQCIAIDAKGLYSVSELGVLGIGALRYQRNTAQCKENKDPEQVELPAKP